MNPDNTNQPAGLPPVTPTPSPMMPVPEKHGTGGIIMLVLIVIVLLAGAYFLMNRIGAQPMPMEATMPVGTESMGAPTMVGGDAQVSASAETDPNTVQGTSVDLSEIEKDLNATDLDTISADLNAI